jgi:anaerobic ribonucleoside-triphosphate reductase activating protein
MRVAGIVKESIVDGPGIRFTVFTQGCSIQCEGCHNPDTWDYVGGTEMTVQELAAEMLSNPLTDGLTISGGEPFEQASECAQLAGIAQSNGLNVWVYTGRTYEGLLDESETNAGINSLLKLTNVLVDGRFIREERTMSLEWRGSKNQRLIYLKNGKRREDS